MQSVKVKFAYPERLSRVQLLLKTLFGWLYVGIPHLICLGLLFFAANLASAIAWFAALFTGKYPPSLFSFMLGFHNWSIRVGAYLGLLCDGYPPFAFQAQYPASFNVNYPARLSRSLLLLRLLSLFYVGVPHGFCLVLRFIAHCAVSFIAWWAVLFTGRIPAGMFSFMSGTYRWVYNVFAYIGFLTDEYPPFSGKAEGVQVNASVAV